jgi:hypothetical protein
METNRVALLPLEVRHQSFELRHDSIGGKVTTGYEGLRTDPTTIAPRFGRYLSNDGGLSALSRRPKFDWDVPDTEDGERGIQNYVVTGKIETSGVDLGGRSTTPIALVLVPQKQKGGRLSTLPSRYSADSRIRCRRSRRLSCRKS